MSYSPPHLLNTSSTPASMECDSNCTNRATIAQQAKEIEKLQLDLLRAQVFKVGLEGQVKRLKDAVDHGGELVAEYDNEVACSRAGMRLLSEAITSQRRALEGYISNAQEVPHVERGGEMLRLLERSKNFVQAWGNGELAESEKSTETIRKMFDDFTASHGGWNPFLGKALLSIQKDN